MLAQRAREREHAQERVGSPAMNVAGLVEAGGDQIGPASTHAVSWKKRYSITRSCGEKLAALESTCHDVNTMRPQ